MPNSSALARAAADFRAQLIGGQAEAGADMVRAYQAVYERTNARLQAVLADIERDVRDVRGGKAPGVERLYERDRLQSIISQTGDELNRFAAQANTVITARQRASVELAQEHAKQVAKVALGPTPPGATGPTWTHLPSGSLEDLAGFSSNGSPLHKILGQLAPDGAARVREAILNGVAQGRTHGDIAREMRDALGANMSRTLTVLRTEDMRAYRESQRRAFVKNDDVIKSTIWIASLSADTCPACLMMHGKEFPPDYIMETHVNCRCVLVPKTYSWEELGHPGLEESQINIESGEAWFNSQSDENKAQILGKAGFEAFRRGDVGLKDFVAYSHSPEWGGMYHARSVKGAMQAAANSPATPPSGAPAPKPAPAVPPTPAPVAAVVPTVPVFKTTAEAEQWLSAQGFTNVSFKGLHPEVAGEAAKAIHEFKTLYPKLQLDAVAVKKATSGGRPSWTMQNVVEGRLNGIDAVTNRLEINKAWFGQFKSLQEAEDYVAKVAASGHWVPQTVRELIFHEMGHTMTYCGRVTADAVTVQRTLTPLRFDAAKLSRYGSTNGREGIAECFAKAARGESIAGVKIKGSTETAQSFIHRYTGVNLP